MSAVPHEFVLRELKLAPGNVREEIMYLISFYQDCCSLWNQRAGLQALRMRRRCCSKVSHVMASVDSLFGVLVCSSQGACVCVCVA